MVDYLITGALGEKWKKRKTVGRAKSRGWLAMPHRPKYQRRVDETYLHRVVWQCRLERQ